MVRHSFALLLSAATNEWRCGILDEITFAGSSRFPMGVWWLGSQLERNKFDCMHACSESRVRGIIARFSKIERTEKKLRHNYLKPSNSECVACASIKGSHIPS